MVPIIPQYQTRPLKGSKPKTPSVLVVIQQDAVTKENIYVHDGTDQFQHMETNVRTNRLKRRLIRLQQ